MDMDVKEETRKLKLVLVVAVIFCLAGYKSCTEIRYTLSGVKTEARVTEVFDAAEARFSAPDRWAVVYMFKDQKGKRQTGRFDVPAAEASDYEGSTIPVVYLPGSPETSTPVERRSMAWPIIFVCMSGFFAWSLWSMTRTKR